MKLNELVKGINYQIIQGAIDEEIEGIAYDSRRVKPGYLFICITGLKTNGHHYINQALDNGAAAILAEHQYQTNINVSYLITPSTRHVMPVIAANYYNRPSRDLRLIGVTGTNGKTSTTHLIKAILEEDGRKTGIMGTLYARIGTISQELGHTTPEAVEIEEFINLCRNEKAEYVVMEVSSHALDLHRVDCLYFHAAVFTNLTQDHLDYHLDMANYLRAKQKLFQMIPDNRENFVIVNADDEYAPDIIKASSPACYTYGTLNQADVKALHIKTDFSGTIFTVAYGDRTYKLNIKLIGLFSVYNTLAAICFALQEGIQMETIIAAIEKIDGVPGRFEQVNCGQNFSVVVDYAHTPDGLENILKTARQITGKRLLTVFGCGGDRDRSKRPKMGEIAARYSDFCIATSDNPRSEEPQAIINDIIPGMEKIKDSRYAIIIDRREAIRHAIYLAKTGDMVVIAGKGHETYQLIKDQVIDFDDRQVAREFLKGKTDDYA